MKNYFEEKEMASAYAKFDYNQTKDTNVIKKEMSVSWELNRYKSIGNGGSQRH